MKITIKIQLRIDTKLNVMIYTEKKIHYEIYA